MKTSRGLVLKLTTKTQKAQSYIIMATNPLRSKRYDNSYKHFVILEGTEESILKNKFTDLDSSLPAGRRRNVIKLSK